MKSKIGYLILGLIVGVTLGVVFDVGIKTIIHQVRELHLSLNKIGVQQNQISQRLDSIQGKLKDTKKPAAVNKEYTQAAVTTNTKSTNGRGQEAKQDTGSVDSVIAEKERGDSNIVVMTNQLVAVTISQLKNADSASVNKSNQRSDSVLASMENADEQSDPSYYRIEFWQSPLNFKGYKMSRGKLVLYGINSTSHVSLVKWEDEYYLVANQSAYKVVYTDDYKPFERVTDKTVLKKFSL